MSEAAGHGSQTAIIGLSGPSSSGKTTVARLLRAVFDIPPSAATRGRSCSLTIIHQDDFYKTDAEIPTTTTPAGRQLQDWDCAASLDLVLLESTLGHIARTGALPPSLHSKEDQNTAAPSAVAESTIATLHARATAWFAALPLLKHTKHLRLFVLDGFLLYPDPDVATQSIPESITALLQVKLFLRSTHALTKARREARSGYVTLEGFWEDPQGYVDEVVWPNYVREHAWMFEGGDVDRGEVKQAAVRRQRIVVGPGYGEKGVGELLEWSLGVLEREIAEHVEIQLECEAMAGNG